MRRLAAALIAVMALAVPAVAQVQKVLPSTEAEFASLLSGCWEEGWHAQFVDGTEGEGSAVVCFQNDGDVTFTFEDHHHDRSVSTKGVGLYELKDDKLHLNNTDSSVEWPFLQPRVQCDAVIMPGETLDLTECTGDGTELAVEVFSFGRSANEVLLGCWSDQSSSDAGSDGQFVPHTEFCFEPDYTLRVTKKMADEEFVTVGDYEFHGLEKRMFLDDETGLSEGWLFGNNRYVSCLASIVSDTLQLTECVSGADYLDTTFIGLRQ